MGQMSVKFIENGIHMAPQHSFHRGCWGGVVLTQCTINHKNQN